MKKKFWKKKIQWFLVDHPFFEDHEHEKIYTPKEGIKFCFWIEGNLQIEGIYNELEINFNDADLLILSKSPNRKGSSVFRIPWNRIITIELSSIDEHDTEIGNLLRINPEQSN